MEYTTLLIAALTAITALAALARSAVDWRVAQLKLKAEMAQRTAPTEISARIQAISRRRDGFFWLRIIWFMVVVFSSLAGLWWLAFGPLRDQPLTIHWAALIAICTVNVFIAHQNNAA
jgi:hypothetical protein